MKRTQIHQRQIICNGYLREDGLWDIEACLTDTKSHPLKTAQRGIIPTGEKIHKIWLKLTLDDQLLIHQVEARTEAAPFTSCAEVNASYKKLEGVKIASGWNRKVKQLFSGVKGCTHLNELLPVVATSAIQTIYPYRDMRPEITTSDEKSLNPVLHNSCHSFDLHGDIVKTYWPESYLDTNERSKTVAGDKNA